MPNSLTVNTMLEKHYTLKVIGKQTKIGRFMTKQEAVINISANVEQIQKLISECRDLASFYGVPFNPEYLDFLNADEKYNLAETEGWNTSNC